MTYASVSINTPPPYLTLASNEKLPVVLSIAGTDPSGGAGLEADMKTITAHRCYAMTCVTSVNVQTPAKVYSIHNTPKDVVSQILDTNLQDMKCDVIKTGMLTVPAIEVLHEKLLQLGENRPKLVVDPVFVATAGSSLAGEDVVTLIRDKIAPFAEVLTPNIPECFKLLGEERKINKLHDIFEIGKELAKITKCANILVKGGHIPWSDEGEKYITDVLYLGAEQKFIVFKGNFVNTTHTHGTGCTLASAIASNLARGYSLPQSVYGGVEYVQNAVAIGCDVTNPQIKDNGPINHVYAIEIPLEKMITDECFTALDVLPKKQIASAADKIPGGNFFEYLINHPKVKPHWDSYVNHEFVKKVADGTLERKKFRFFIEQDYAYLVDYARVHCIAGSKAPCLEDIEKELSIVASVRNEMGEHEKRLTEEFGVPDQAYFQNIARGPALKAYSRYFNDVSRRGNWQELVAALTPCLMGYGYALTKMKGKVTAAEGSAYYKWCETYSSPWYCAAMAEGELLLNHILETYPPEQLDTLVTIYAEVCELETNFWTAALEYE
ncbi:trifunctional hydroxymethylpyrimidine kinase/phosphomethylpyrimidine kinase/thiaminase [Saccharomyces eubayanus]|uniref:trifunctional hydroxymethylpyrimidine kinase/phosphomethylpyrimidine kinase/thiaminase n=1 Tax=Saccharomyces eubayanus TaxID=1080349 RepID=UPI0006C63F1D|nr:THI20-like protein [Saccharomyces eubayanus]KOG99018.1 THI20-like protein [Saccharomyces eubayanus]